MIRRALDISLEAGLDEEAAIAYINLGCALWMRLDLEAAAQSFSEGLRLCQDRDIRSYGLAAQSNLADMSFWAGEWNRAVELGKPVLASNDDEDLRHGRAGPHTNPAAGSRGLAAAGRGKTIGQ
jgi:tetratricopeptide (TPR) repeat protein